MEEDMYRDIKIESGNFAFGVSWKDLGAEFLDW
jgi:hypothetical protein